MSSKIDEVTARTALNGIDRIMERMVAMGTIDDMAFELGKYTNELRLATGLHKVPEGLMMAAHALT